MMEVRDENTWFTEYLPPNKNNLKFYKEHYYWDLACYVSISDNTVNNKTVHKAKGDEFENVLLVLEKEEDIKKAFEFAKEHTDAPTILEFMIDSDELVLPMVQGGQALDCMILDC